MGLYLEEYTPAGAPRIRRATPIFYLIRRSRLAQPNYRQRKKQREQAKQKKNEAKRQRRIRLTEAAQEPAQSPVRDEGSIEKVE